MSTPKVAPVRHSGAQWWDSGPLLWGGVTLSALAVVLAITLTIALAVGASAMPVPEFTPDAVAGESVYAGRCGTCHGPRNASDLADRSWKDRLAPADVVNMAQSGALDHPQLDLDEVDAWNATAYVWLLSLTPEEVQTGERLVGELESRRDVRAVMTLLTQRDKIAQLRDRNWVLTHPLNDVSANFQKVAGSAYDDFSDAERRSLAEFLPVSYFSLPPGWRLESCCETP